MFRKNVGETSKKSGCQRKSEDILKVSPSTPTSPNFQHARRLTEFQSTPDCYTVVAIDSPLMKSKTNGVSMEFINGNSYSDGKEDSSMITVGVRVRPFTQRELVEDTKCIISMSGNETVVKPEKGDICRFTYDYSFWSFDDSSANYADQTYVYEALAHPLLVKVLQGYNACLFAYGQTGSGKSYSIMGHGKDVGVVPRFCEELFQRIQDNMAHDCNVTFNVELSFFEIYNEKIHDLLGSSCGKDKSCKKPSLRVREHPVMGPFVDGLSSYVVKSFDDVSTWLVVGSKRRATASTCMNDSSSRSHSVFTLMITQTKTSVIDESVHKHNIISKINLVDLAGSERQSTAKTTGDRLREGASINKSLMALGKVISILSEQSSVYGRNRKNFIPYRETILTWLLKESLGGNSKTSMLATISPSSLNLEETLSTLRYARQARNIINTARINEDQNARIIRNLQAEIEKLKMMAGGSDFGEEKCLMEIRLLKDELLKKEMEMADLTRSWQEKLKQSEACKQEEARLLEKFGVSSKVDPDQPCLMNLNEDPQLSEVLFYMIKEGITRVGRMRDDCNLDIQLNGALVADEHCKFDLRNGAASITPFSNSACYVNGHEVPAGSSMVIHNGDRIVLAGDHFFRFINPLEEKLISGTAPVHSLLPKDFYFAYQEFTTMQNARLEAELTKVKVQHTEEMKIMEAEKKKQKADMQEQLSANRQKTSSLQADYESRLNKLKDMLCEHKEAEMHDQVKKLEREKEALERQLHLLKLTQDEKHDVLSRNYNSNLLEFIDTIEKDIREFMNTGQRLDILETCDETNKLLLMLKEANNISLLLHKDLKFTREHLSNSELVVKVQRVHMNLSTYWSIDRFKGKLQQMKDLYQGRIESCEADEILFDPKDVWQCNSQSDVASSFSRQNMHQSSTLQSIVSSSFFECSLDSLDLSLSDSKLVSKPSKCYSQMIQASLQDFKDLTIIDSTADRVLYASHKIYFIVDDLHSYNQSLSKVQEGHQNDNCLMYLVHSFHSLQGLVSQWLLQLSSSHSDVITTSKDLLFDVVSDLGYHIQMFIQGFENNVSSLVTEFYPKIKSNLQTICSVSGKLSLSCQLDCYSLKNIQLVESENKYTSRVVDVILKKSFLAGCSEFVMQALLAANNVLVESKHRLMELSRSRNSEICEPSKELLKRTYRAVSSTTLLLKKLEALQLQLTNPAEEDVVGDHILASFQTCKSLCLQFSSIVDCALQLIDVIEWIISGEGTLANMSNVKLILDNLNMHLCGLMDSTSTGSNQSFRLENSQLSDLLNDSQMEMLEDAVEEVKEAVNDLSCLTFSGDM